MVSAPAQPRIREIRLAADSPALFRAAASELARIARKAVSLRGRFTVALSGGATPLRLYARLASDAESRDLMPWRDTWLFWGDERHVPPDHPDSNYGTGYKALLSRVPVVEAQVFRILGELPDANEAAMRYEGLLHSALGLADERSRSFDLVILGLGADGHTASLFPGTAALQESRRFAVANWVEKLHAWRVTLTLAAINRARAAMFLVSGAEKAPTLGRVIGGPWEGEALPAELVQPHDGRLIWMADAQAAAGLRLFRP